MHKRALSLKAHVQMYTTQDVAVNSQCHHVHVVIVETPCSAVLLLWRVLDQPAVAKTCQLTRDAAAEACCQHMT